MAIIAAGAVTVCQSLYTLVRHDTPWSWTVLALLTLLSGSFTVKLPSLPATINVSETFVFTSVLLFGVPAGTLTVALDALVISFWSYRRGDPQYKIVFNLFALPLTIWLSSQVFFSLADFGPLFGTKEHVQVSRLLWPLLVLAALYFSLNSWLITFAIALEKRLPPLQIWRQNFIWLSLNYFGGASIAALLVSYTRDIDFSYVALILPLLVVLYLMFSTSMGRVADANAHLSQLNTLYMSTIETLAMAIDAKDQITHGHIRRVQVYAVGLAKKVGVTDPALIQAIEAAALLHDMGKLAVPEYILNKPGPLTPAEFDKMKLHSSVGADILSAIDFPYPVVPIVRHHHESWNGSGYPDGLAGTNIPIGARILSVVDCFDALTSDRPYRPRLSDREAIRILLERRGTMYDPLIVDTFLRVHAELAPGKLGAAESVPLKAITEASSSGAGLTTDDRPLEEIAASSDEMLTLFDLARGLNNQMSVQDAADVIAKHLRRLVPSSLCVFFLYELDTDELVACHASGENAALAADLRIGVGQRLSGWVAAHKQVIRNSDPVLDFGEAARSMSPRPRSCLSAPLISDGSLVGVLSLYAAGRDAFNQEQQRILEVVSRQVSTILKQADEYERTKLRALRDHVTGLPNVERLWQLTRSQMTDDQTREPLSVLLLNIEGLSVINDRYGRSRGDEVLGTVVRATRKSLRAADFLFKYKDDKFIVLLLQTDERTSTAISQRITEAIDGEAVGLNKSKFKVRVTSATSPADGRSIEALIEVAETRVTGPHTTVRHPHQSPKSIH